MEFLLFDILQSGIGRLYLLLRYRRKELISKVLEEKYEGSYSNAGKLLSLNFFAVLFGLLLFGFMISFLIGLFK
ncbi:hypothetical protein [Pontibacter brevis]